MILLAIDTSHEEPAVGVQADGRPRLIAAPPDAATGRRHGRDLLPCIRDLLAAGGLTVRDLNRVAVGLGPGSYTGLRIGLTAARTLAYSTGAELVGLDSLEVWARTAPAAALRVHVVADAQRGDVYAADFTRETPGQPLRVVSASRLEPLADWAKALDPAGVIVGLGTNSAAIRAEIPAGQPVQTPAQAGSSRLRATALLDLAQDVFQLAHRDDFWTLEPRYFRRSAAEDQWETRARAATPR